MVEQFLRIIVVFVRLLHCFFSDSFHCLYSFLFFREESLPQVRFTETPFSLS